MRAWLWGAGLALAAVPACAQVLGIEDARPGWKAGSSTTTGNGGAGGMSTATSTAGTGGTGGSPLPPCNADAGVGVVCWDQVWGEDGTHESLAVGAGADGRIFVAGKFSGSMQLDATQSLTGDVAGDGFVVGLAPSGAVAWVQSIVGPQVQTVSALTVDPGGNVVVGGYTQSTASLGSFTIPPGLFTAELASDGTPLWVTALGGSDGSAVNDLSATSAGIVACGDFLGTINLGQGPVNANGGAMDTGTDAWVGTISDANGSLINGLTWGDGATQTCRGARADGMGSIIVAGSFAGQVTIGTGKPALVCNGINDLYLAKISLSAGWENAWQKQFGLSAETTGFAMDGTGQVIITGQYAGMINFDGQGYAAPPGSSIFFAAVYGNDGTVKWTKSFGNGGEVHAAFGPSGEVVLAGGYIGTIGIGNDAVMNNGANHAIFAVKLNSAGDELWTRSFGDGSGESEAHAVTFTPAGDTVAVGEVNGAYNFGSGPKMATGAEAFVMTFGE